MTPCTICATPCHGTDDDDAPCCAWCDAANLAGAEVRPPASVTRGCRRRLAPAPWLLEVLADEDGREG